MNARDSRAVALSVLLATIVGYVNTHTDELGIITGSLLIGAYGGALLRGLGRDDGEPGNSVSGA